MYIYIMKNRVMYEVKYGSISEQQRFCLCDSLKEDYLSDCH